MTDKDIIDTGSAFIKKHGFACYLAISICFGYTFGKDLAMKHNAQDAAAAICDCENESLSS